MNYDLIIPCHPKDYVKLHHCANSCLKYLNPKPSNIYVVSPDVFQTSDDLIKHVFDDDAIGVHIQDIKFHRKNWIYQQFIKLGQDFTQNDLYLCVDSDLFFNRPIDLFDGDRPKLFISDRDQRHQPYFDFMKKYQDLDRQVNHTFINDFMLFDKNICREIVGDLESLLSFCNQNLSDNCLLSEFELYGDYISKHYPEKYGKQNTKTKMFGRHENQPWQQSEIEKYIEHMRSANYDLFTMHTWT